MDSRTFLEPGTKVDSYRIVRVVGAGGFGVTYEAVDLNLGTTVALKEYFPSEFATRTQDSQVRPSSENHSQTFQWGRSGFLEEARTLARFRHPSIVQVFRFFEANATAYMVMAFENGVSLERWLRDLGRPPTQDELDRLVGPLVGALEAMHANNILHRDIAPDNIIIRSDAPPVLLDFGAARKAVAAKTQALTGMFKRGYSPQEQYSAEGKHQGPWSDFYALGAILYRAISGVAPEDAPSRTLHDTLPPARDAAKGNYRPSFLDAIDACLKVMPAQRPQSVAQLRALLAGTINPQPTALDQTQILTRPLAPAPKGGLDLRARMPMLLAFVAGLLALGVAASAYHSFATSQAEREARVREERRVADAALIARINEEQRQREEQQRLQDEEALRRRAEDAQRAEDRRKSEAEERERQALRQKQDDEERLKEKEDRIAAEQKAAQDKDRVKLVQAELKRLGCYKGVADGDWGPMTRAAYVRARTLPALAADAKGLPNDDDLRALRALAPSVCVLVCGANEVEENGACVPRKPIKQEVRQVPKVDPPPAKPKTTGNGGSDCAGGWKFFGATCTKNGQTCTWRSPGQWNCY